MRECHLLLLRINNRDEPLRFSIPETEWRQLGKTLAHHKTGLIDFVRFHDDPDKLVIVNLAAVDSVGCRIHPATIEATLEGKTRRSAVVYLNNCPEPVVLAAESIADIYNMCWGLINPNCPGLLTDTGEILQIQSDNLACIVMPSEALDGNTQNFI